MEYINKSSIEQEKNSLYKYSGDLGLLNIIKERNDENIINNSDNISKEKTEFLIKLANILENKLRINIRLHQKGFETYKQKLTSERDLILNNTRDIKDLTIKQIIDILISIKNNTYNKKNTNYFSIGKIPSNKKKDNNDNILNSLQGMSKILFTQQNTENNFHLRKRLCVPALSSGGFCLKNKQREEIVCKKHFKPSPGGCLFISRNK